MTDCLHEKTKPRHPNGMSLVECVECGMWRDLNFNSGTWLLPPLPKRKPPAPKKAVETEPVTFSDVIIVLSILKRMSPTDRATIMDYLA